MLLRLVTTVELLALNVKFVIVVALISVPDVVLERVQVPLPILKVRTPVPVIDRAKPEGPIATLLLLTLKSRIQPVVDAVQAPIVREFSDRFAFTVIVQVVPLTQVFASSVTSSLPVGADTPVAPPEVADHIAVETLSQVQVVVQTAKRAAA